MSAKHKKNNSGQNIKVFVRVRPLNAIEKGSKSHVKCPDSQRVVVLDRSIDKPFTFDRVFGITSTQSDVFKVVARPLVEEVLNGFSCTIFAYGQTSSGKTFTMEGKHYMEGVSWEQNNSAGIVPRCVIQLFDDLQMLKVEEFTMKVSFLELYNEELYDLLSHQDDFTKLRLYESAIQKGSCQIQGLEEVVVRSKSEVFKILEKGSSKRQTAATNMNDQSSRSHTVFTITVQIKENTEDGDELMKIGKLHLVDLAGSENIGRSGAVDKRAREAGNINTSLLTLGKVITRLKEKAPHIPYRESKLTRLLQDALGGKSKTSIIATVSPASTNVEETLSTLHYANHAKDIKNCPEINKKVTKREILDDYTSEISQLKQALVSQRERDGVYMSLSEYEELLYQVKTQTEENLERLVQIRANEEELEKLKIDFRDVGIELSQTLDKLTGTESKLKDTEDLLECNKKCLSDMTVERDEQVYLVSSHVKTEEKLHDQGNSLITVAKSTTSDIEQLHNKLDRKRHVEATNERTAMEFSQEMTELVTSLKTCKAESMSCYYNSSQVVSQNLGKLAASQGTIQSSWTRDLRDIFAIPSKTYDDMRSMCSHHISEDRKLTEEYSTVLLENYKKECAALKAENELLNSLTRNMAHFISQLGTNVASNDEVSKLIAEVTRICESTSHYSMKNLEDLATKMSTLQEKEVQEIKERELRNSEKYKQKFFVPIKNMLQSLEEEFDADITNCTSYFEQSAEEKSNLTKKMCAVAEQAMQEKAETSTRGVLTATKANELLNITSQNMVSHIAELAKCHQSFESQVDSNCKHRLDAFEELEATTKEAKQAHLKRSQSFEKVFNKKVEDESTRFASESENAIVTLNHEIEIINQKMHLLDTELSSQIKALEASHAEQEEKADDINEQLTAYISEKIAKDVPTGLTPNRREYPYPQSLAKTSPHETLKQRFRRYLNTVSKIPVLELSDAESDKSKDSSLTSEADKFLVPSIPRKNSNEARSAPLSRSSSASSILDMKENLSLDPIALTSSLKKHIKTDTQNVPSAKSKVRRVLGAYN